MRVGALCVLSALLLGIGCGSSRQFLFSPVDPLALGNLRAQQQALAKKHAGSPAVLLLHQTAIEHVVEGGTGTWTLHGNRVRRLLVLADRPWRYRFNLTLRPSWELTGFDVVVLPPDGPARRFSRADLKTTPAPGKTGKTRHELAAMMLPKGTLIEERLEHDYGPQTTLAVLRHAQAVRFDLPCEKVRLLYAQPARWQLQLRKLGAGAPPPMRFEERRGQRIAVYERDDVPGLRREPFSPFPAEEGARVHLAAVPGYVGRRTFKAVDTWEEFAQQFRRSVVDRDAVFSRRVASTASEITRGVGDPLLKLKAIVGFVQRTVRSEGDHEQVSFGEMDEERKDFADVLDKRRGSPWQITGLTVSMLRKAGVDAQFALIHSARDGTFDRSYVYPGNLRVAGVAATVGGKTVIAFPYLPLVPVGVIPAPLQGRPALRLTEKGFGGFFTTPIVEAAGRLEEQIRVGQAPEGALAIEERHTYDGVLAYDLRWELGKGGKKGRRLLAGSLRRVPGLVGAPRISVLDEQQIDRPLTIVYGYTVRPVVDGARQVVIEGLFRPLLTHLARRRTRPIAIHADLAISRRIEIELPAEATLAERLEDLHRATRFGTLDITHELKPGQLRITHTLHLRRSTGKAEELDDLLQLWAVGARSYLTTRSVRLTRQR